MEEQRKRGVARKKAEHTQFLLPKPPIHALLLWNCKRRDIEQLGCSWDGPPHGSLKPDKSSSPTDSLMRPVESPPRDPRHSLLAKKTADA